MAKSRKKSFAAASSTTASKRSVRLNFETPAAVWDNVQVVFIGTVPIPKPKGSPITLVVVPEARPRRRKAPGI